MTSSDGSASIHWLSFRQKNWSVSCTVFQLYLQKSTANTLVLITKPTVHMPTRHAFFQSSRSYWLVIWCKRVGFFVKFINGVRSSFTLVKPHLRTIKPNCISILWCFDVVPYHYTSEESLARELLLKTPFLKVLLWLLVEFSEWCLGLGLLALRLSNNLLNILMNMDHECCLWLLKFWLQNTTP